MKPEEISRLIKSLYNISRADADALLRDSINTIENSLDINEELGMKLIEKAITGSEVTEEISIENWINERLIPNTVYINNTGYARMCLDALKTVGDIAPTDYGRSRQRDFGQLWADVTRGYLGEIAFLQLLRKRWEIEAELGHEPGELADYLPMDIHRIKKPGEDWRNPNKKPGIKSSKFSGIWCDIPGDQFNHSDIHIFVKIGAPRDHIFAFLKDLGVFEDVLLRKGVELGVFSVAEARELNNNIPAFQPVPAYICGFVLKGRSYRSLSYQGKKGRIHYRITGWQGPINQSNDLIEIKRRERLIAKAKVDFEGIGEFGHDSGYLFNSGNLLWKNRDWEQEVIQQL